MTLPAAITSPEQAGNAVTVSAAATVAQTEQTQARFNLTLGGNTSGVLALLS
jgi:hypothetical protein